MPSDVRIIDAHVHLWDVDRVSIPWFRDDLGLPGRASAADLRSRLVESGVSSAIAVQAADTLEEARWLVGTTSRDPLIRHAVLQYSPAQGRPAGATADAFAPHVAGVRAAVPQFAADLSDVNGLDALADRLGATGLVLEMLIRPEQLAAVAALSRRHPSTSIVICHLGLGAAAADAAWRAALDDAASAPGVFAKVSGLALPARDAAEAGSIIAAAVDAFGAGRLMFGSDWPMSVRSCSYADVLTATRAALPPLADAEAAAFWSGTAARLYRLGS